MFAERIASMSKKRHVSLRGIERGIATSHGSRSKSDTIVLSFNTRQHGTLQVGYRDNVVQFRDEPNLNIFTDADRNYIETTLMIASRMIKDSSAHKERFER